MGTVAIAVGGLAAALLMGFVEPLASDAISTAMRAAMIPIAIATVIAVGLRLNRVHGAM